jgi:3-hydroxyacyl-[acyl-carrier-protein] dehydratase
MRVDPKTIDICGILKLIPHRAPFVLVDRVLTYETGVHLTALKNVTYNEPFFPGHFPQVPTMPGVLILEAMAQACGILAVLTSGVRPETGHILYFAGIDNARFKRPVVPGDRLELRAELQKQKRDLWKFLAQASVDDELACSAEMMCVVKQPVGTDIP